MHKNKENIYIGSTGKQLKARFYKPTQSFRSAIKKECTILNRFIHKIKNDNIDWKKNNQVENYSSYKPQ